MSASNPKVKSYFNTLIFTIISGIFSLVLMAALFFEIFKGYLPLIVTVEVGLFIIIGYCIYKIYENESIYEIKKSAKNFIIDFQQCPEYYVKRIIDGNTICSNEYVTEDKFQKKQIIKIYPEDIAGQTTYSFPSNHSNTYVDSNNPQEKFRIDTISNNNTLSTKDKCNVLYGNNQSLIKYSRLPWTGLKSRCNAYISI